MQRWIVSIMLGWAVVFAMAEENLVMHYIVEMYALEGNADVVEGKGAYSRIALGDSVTVEVFETDSITLVMTACAPQCSSRVRIYNKEWQFVRYDEPPFRSVFPLATMNKETGEVTWSDNDTWEYRE